MRSAALPVSITEATEASQALRADVERLICQLSPGRAVSVEELREIVSSPASRLLIARDVNGAAVGTLTVALFPIPSGLRAWIEDVVVDDVARSRGVGEALVRVAIELAHAAGARTIELTSRPSRAAANRLYRRLGVEVRDTNVYRLRGPPLPGHRARP